MKAAEYLLGLARHFAGVGCPACGGRGRRAYASTAVWRGGVGGQAITDGVCDCCWGSGRTDRSGANLREIDSMACRLRALEGGGGGGGGGGGRCD